jgi:hypothetical protein
MNSRNAQATLYAHYFHPLKKLASKIGYNLFLNADNCDDLNLVAVPWEENVSACEELIEQIKEEVKGAIVKESEEERNLFAAKFNGRREYKILVQQGLRKILFATLDEGEKEPVKFTHYIKISVTPTVCLVF